jgi:hypothetical protein
VSLPKITVLLVGSNHQLMEIAVWEMRKYYMPISCSIDPVDLLPHLFGLGRIRNRQSLNPVKEFVFKPEKNHFPPLRLLLSPDESDLIEVLPQNLCGDNLARMGNVESLRGFYERHQFTAGQNIKSTSGDLLPIGSPGE